MLFESGALDEVASKGGGSSEVGSAGGSARASTMGCAATICGMTTTATKLKPGTIRMLGS